MDIGYVYTLFPIDSQNN